MFTDNETWKPEETFFDLNFKTPCLCSRGPTLILPPSDQLIPILQLAVDLLTNGCPLK